MPLHSLGSKRRCCRSGPPCTWREGRGSRLACSPAPRCARRGRAFLLRGSTRRPSWRRALLWGWWRSALQRFCLCPSGCTVCLQTDVWCRTAARAAGLLRRWQDSTFRRLSKIHRHGSWCFLLVFFIIPRAQRKSKLPFVQFDITGKTAQESCLKLYKYFSQLDKKPEKLIDFLRKVCYNKTMRRKSCKFHSMLWRNNLQDILTSKARSGEKCKAAGSCRSQGACMRPTLMPTESTSREPSTGRPTYHSTMHCPSTRSFPRRFTTPILRRRSAKARPSATRTPSALFCTATFPLPCTRSAWRSEWRGDILIRSPRPKKRCATSCIRFRPCIR